MLNLNEIKALLQFMSRVQLQGTEVPAFVTVTHKLNEWGQALEKEADEKKASDKPKKNKA